MDDTEAQWWLRHADGLRCLQDRSKALREAKVVSERLVKMAQTRAAPQPYVVQTYRDLVAALEGKRA